MTLNDGLVQTREADTGDRATPVVALNYDFDSNTGKWGPRAAGSSGGTEPELETVDMISFPMNGTSLPLPAPPAGATALRFQPQDGDVRVATNGSPSSSSSGIKYAEEGIYNLRSSDWTKARFYGPAGVTVLLLWDGPQ